MRYVEREIVLGCESHILYTRDKAGGSAQSTAKAMSKPNICQMFGIQDFLAKHHHP